MKPLISVLIPSYNYGRFIEKSVDSVLAQTYDNFEVVVTDNRSTDTTMQILRAHYGSDPRVRIFENETNIGLTENFNRALAHARGEFVVWLCADDWFLSGHLARLYDVFAHHPRLDVVYTNIYFADERGRAFAIKAETSQLGFDYVDIRDELPEMLATFSQLCLPTALIRRAVLDELGGLDPTIPTLSDWELAIRFAVAGKRFGYLSEPSACVRAHVGNESGTDFHNSGRYVLELLTIAERYVDHPALNRLFGRQAAFMDFVDRMVASVRSTIGRDPFSADVHARIANLRSRFEAHAARVDPARVREARISVIVPVNGLPADALGALDSLHAQTFANWEAIVVDSSATPLRELLRDHPAADRIVYVRLPAALPPGGARNFAMRFARGEYLAFLDEDNRLAPGHFEALVGAIESSGVLVAATSARLLVVRQDVRALDNELLATVEGLYRGPNASPGEGRIANSLPLNALIAHRRAFLIAGAFNDSVSLLEDFDQIMRFEAITAIPVLADATLDIYARIGLVGQTLGQMRAFYLPTLDALYASRDVEPAIARERARHRARIESALAQFTVSTGTPAGVVAWLAVFAGREVPGAAN